MWVKKYFAAVFIIVLTAFSFAACSRVESYSNLIVNGNFVSYDQSGALIESEVTYRNWVREKNVSDSYEAYTLKTDEESVILRSPVPVYANKKYKTSRWSETFPEGWKVGTSDPAVASLAGFEYGDRGGDSNAVTFIVNAESVKSGGVTPIGCGWVRIYQKVRVNPHTNYKITFDYYGFMRRPNSLLGDKAQNAAGVNAGFLEDPSYVDSQALESSNFSGLTNKEQSKKYTSQVFNSGSLRHLTVCISVGAPGRDVGDSRVNIAKISMMEEIPAASSVHTIYRNGGYKDTNAAAVVFTVAAFIFLVVLCFFAAYYINKNYVYSKAKDDDGAKPKAPRGKVRKADLSADEGDFLEVPLTDAGAESAGDTGAQESAESTESTESVKDTESAPDAVKPEIEESAESTESEESTEADAAESYADERFEGGADPAGPGGAKGPAKAAGRTRVLLGKALAAVKTAWAKRPFLVLLGLAFAVRILCVFLFKGYRPDISAALAVMEKILGEGVKYYSLNGVDYAPGTLYIYCYAGLFKDWFNLADGGTGMTFLLKLPALAADLGIGYIIYSFTKGFVNKKTALGISALYLFNPAVIFAFEIWGGTAAVWLFFTALTLRYMLDRKYLKMCAAYAGAVLFSESALAIAPLLGVFLIAVFVKAFSAYWRWTVIEKKPSSGLLALPKYSAVWKAPAAMLLFFVSLFFLCLPLTAAGVDGEKFKLFSFCSVYAKLASDFAFHTVNGFNVAAFMGRNGPLFIDVSKTSLIAVYFLMCMILAAIYVMKRNRANLLLLFSFIYFFSAYFMADVTPLTAIPGLVILLLGCAAIGDRRLFGLYLIFSAVCLLNISAVMISAQYMNNLPDYLLDPDTNSAYGGSVSAETNLPMLPQWFMIAGSVIALIGFFYYLFIVMDITVASRRKVFMPFDPENSHYALDTFKSIFW